MDNGDFLKAIEYFDKALEISPKYYPPTFNKAKAYYYAGLYEDALIWFNKSKFSGRCIDNYVILSWIRDTLNELNRFDEAIKAYKEAIDIINEDYDWTINFHKEQRWDSPSDSYLNSLLDKRNERVSSIKYFLSIIFSNWVFTECFLLNYSKHKHEAKNMYKSCCKYIEVKKWLI